MNGWRYEDHPNRDSVRIRIEELVESSALCEFSALSYLLNTCPRHAYIFALVTPPNQEGYAGNYRGSNFPYLQGYQVFFGRPGEMATASNSGTLPWEVANSMQQFHGQLANQLSKLREFLSQSNRAVDEKAKIVALFIGIFFVGFLSIHPYANGNGHISRLIVRSMFDVLGFNCRNWRVAARNDVPGDDLVAQFRAGDPRPLVLAFLNMVDAEAGVLQ